MTLYGLDGQFYAMPVNDTARIIEDLTYDSYCHQRRLAPQIAPERWRAVFVDADKLEQRYQAERKGESVMYEAGL